MKRTHPHPSLQPWQDYVLVQLDPLLEKSTTSGIIILKDTTANVVRTGVVLRKGPGRLSPKGNRIPVGLERGEKIAFLRWHLEHQTGKQVMGHLQELGDDLALVREPDVLFAYLAHEHVEVG